MSQDSGQFFTAIHNQAESQALLERLTDAANVKAVYSQPVDKGDYTVIAAAETHAVIGFGYGLGGEMSSQSPTDPDALTQSDPTFDGGGGGGGGGTVHSRPVAVISIGPDGVNVQPVVDVTKIALTFFTTFFTTFGSVLMLQRKMKRRYDD